ncbi:MAG: hypothetical protein COV47_02740 [Candidatus Diapherotrites archaeon CG11_big_fil_rev_8_21_14_0_20_37_9]|nr:MAG: hypothetical protein COV47_02740 [Candidatus Diapherotrites archaeon CG11_big_fil_rev_8_21_14_0_20_37_9]
MSGHSDHGPDDHGSHGEHKEHKEHKGHKEHKEEKKEKSKNSKKPVLEEAEVIVLLLLAIMGRIALEPFASVEPIIPIAVYAGLAYGSSAGILIGLLAYPASNFFLRGGPFGLWTILQGAAGATAGGLAGNNNKLTTENLLLYTFLGTLIFELFLNIGSGGFLIWPYSITHIVTNLIFAVLISAGIKQK